MPNFRLFREQFGDTLNPGTLRHQITWQRRTVTGQNSFGDDVATWGNWVTCRASVTPVSGREISAAGQRWAEAQYRIVQHYHPGLLPTDRISWYVDGVVRTLDVVDIPPGDGRIQVVYAKDHVG